MRGRFTLIVVMIFQTHLDRVLVGEEVDNFEGMCNNADGQELLAVVAALHHQANCASIPGFKKARSGHKGQWGTW